MKKYYLDNKFKSKKIEKTDIVFSDVFESHENNINAQIIKYNDIVLRNVSKWGVINDEWRKFSKEV